MLCFIQEENVISKKLAQFLNWPETVLDVVLITANRKCMPIRTVNTSFEVSSISDFTWRKILNVLIVDKFPPIGSNFLANDNLWRFKNVKDLTDLYMLLILSENQLWIIIGVKEANLISFDIIH